MPCSHGDIIAAPMIECPYCFAAVKPEDPVCSNCGRPIERWRTGFYSRKALPARGRTAVQVGAILVFLLIVALFARSCHWV
jgi:predicted amidophosphoribosyltransferase